MFLVNDTGFCSVGYKNLYNGPRYHRRGEWEYQSNKFGGTDGRSLKYTTKEPVERPSFRF